jgi:hypothetical protein
MKRPLWFFTMFALFAIIEWLNVGIVLAGHTNLWELVFFLPAAVYFTWLALRGWYEWRLAPPE